MKEIFSKTINERITKEAGFWDTLKGVGRGIENVYNKGQDFYQKARLGWELGKMQTEPQWKQRLNAMMYSNMYPTKYDAETQELVPAYTDPKTGAPINPYFVKGLLNKMTKSHRGGYGGEKHKLPKGKIINPAKASNPEIERSVQAALTMLYDMHNGELFNELVNEQVIVNEKDIQQQGVQSKQPPVAAPQSNPPLQPNAGQTPPTGQTQPTM